MFFIENCILGIPYNKELEADLLESFLDDDSILLFPWVESNLWTFVPDSKYYTFNINEFALGREVFRSDETIGNINSNTKRMIIWFSPKNRNELIEVIRFLGITYQCCVLKKGLELKDYTLYLDIYEHFVHLNNEYRGLYYFQSKSGNYKEKALEKLGKVVEEFNNKNNIKDICL